MTTDLTGAQIIQVLEEQWQPEGASRPFLKLGVSDGLEYTYDPAAAAGERITRVTFEGVELDPAATYSVVVNSFLASGGDNFATLAEGANARDTGRVDLEAFVDYMAEFSPDVPIAPDLGQRAVGVHVVDEPAGGTVAPGAEVTLELSSLLFSAGEEQGTTLTVTVDGEAAGTATIDPMPVDTTDEVGRATVTVTVPDDAVDGDGRGRGDRRGDRHHGDDPAHGRCPGRRARARDAADPRAGGAHPALERLLSWLWLLFSGPWRP